MPIFRNARPYITAYGFQHMMCWLVSWEAGKTLKMGIMMPETC